MPSWRQSSSKGSSLASTSYYSSGSLVNNCSTPRSVALKKSKRRPTIRGAPRGMSWLLPETALWRAVCVAIPCAVASGGLRMAITMGFVDILSDLNDVDTAWSAFSTLVTFLVVFRTSHSYLRFWEGCTSCHRMRAEWYDACSALISFCRCSTAPRDQVKNFEHSLVRLFSLLHGIALAEIEDRGDEVADIEAFNFELLDPVGFDEESLSTLLNCEHKLELLFQWVQCLITENVQSGVLCAPPPILTRAYSELNNGMVAFHEASKISTIPFPLPYVQACDWMLIIHYCCLPLILPKWVGHPGWAFAFAFIQVFILWMLKFTASEIENPFGTDSNDLDRKHIQQEMNGALMFLVSPDAKRLPKLRMRRSDILMGRAEGEGRGQTIQTVLSDIRRGSVVARRSIHRDLPWSLSGDVSSSSDQGSALPRLPERETSDGSHPSARGCEPPRSTQVAEPASGAELGAPRTPPAGWSRWRSPVSEALARQPPMVKRTLEDTASSSTVEEPRCVEASASPPPLAQRERTASRAS